MLQLKNVSKYYPGFYRKALDEVDLTIQAGEIIALLGPNGAGKTTLFRCILGLEAFHGTMTLDGQPITHESRDRFAFATHLHSFFPKLNPHEHKEFYQLHFSKFDERRYEKLMSFFDLSPRAKLETFSAGQQNQYEVILALSQGADFILMDEPFAANDLLKREDFYRLLLGILKDHETLILASHLVDEIDTFVSRAICMDDGKIVADWDLLEDSLPDKSLRESLKVFYQYDPAKVEAMMQR